MRLTKAGFDSGVDVISSGRNIGIFLYSQNVRASQARTPQIQLGYGAHMTL